MSGSLVLHADDFGLNAAVTQGIVDGFSEGLLTSTSLLTSAPAAAQALSEWKRLEEVRRSGGLLSANLRRRVSDLQAPFDLGVHLNLTQGRPLTGQSFPGDLLDARGRFLSPGKLFLKLLTGGRRWSAALLAELSTQVEWLVDRGLRPTHLNGHQYIEMMPVVSGLLPALAARYAVPNIRAACEPGHWRTSLLPGRRWSNWCLSLVKRHFANRSRRALDASGIAHTAAFFGSSHAGRIDLQLVRRFLNLACQGGLTEIALHPGRPPVSISDEAGADGWHDPLATARPLELELLCSGALADLLAIQRFSLTRLHFLSPNPC
jgi:chitin disaccharide deacetylase